MTATLLSHDLQTNDITVISNLTSVTVVGSRISTLNDLQTVSKDRNATVHLDFNVKDPANSSGVLGSTESLGMILSQSDAVNLGLWLLVMGLKHNTTDSVDAIMVRLSQQLKNLK